MLATKCVCRKWRRYTPVRRWPSVRDVVVRHGPTRYKNAVAACRRRVNLTSAFCVSCRTTTHVTVGRWRLLPILPLLAVARAGANWDVFDSVNCQPVLCWQCTFYFQAQVFGNFENVLIFMRIYRWTETSLIVLLASLLCGYISTLGVFRILFIF